MDVKLEKDKLMKWLNNLDDETIISKIKHLKNSLSAKDREKDVSRQGKKGVDVYDYCGKINLNKDALVIQKELRNEWEYS